jgi:hypothetical protein
MRAIAKVVIPPTVLAVILLAAILAPLAGCGATTREKTIHAAFLATNAARDGFTKFDAEHQLDIVDKAQTKEEGRAALDLYRAKRIQIVELFEAAYYAISAAVVLKDDPTSMAHLVEAATKLKAGLDALMTSK